MSLPVPMAMDDRYVVLTPDQWDRLCRWGNVGRLPRPYEVSFNEVLFQRSVILQDTIGM